MICQRFLLHFYEKCHFDRLFLFFYFPDSFLLYFLLSASATTGGTMPDMSPPNIASSFIELDFTMTYRCSVGMKRVSIFALRLWFISDKSNSYAKSFEFLIPRRRTFACIF